MARDITRLRQWVYERLPQPFAGHIPVLGQLESYVQGKAEESGLEPRKFPTSSQQISEWIADGVRQITWELIIQGHYCPAKILEGHPNPLKISVITQDRSENDLN